MSRKPLAAFSAALLLVGATPRLAFAQLANALVKPDCASTTYPSGVTRQVVQTTSGLVCTTATATGTFVQATAGTTGAAVPSSADYQGVNVGGNLVGRTGTTSGSFTAGHVLAPDSALTTGTITNTQSITFTPAAGGYATFGYQITGTWTGNILIEATVDGSNWFATTAVPLNLAASVPSGNFTANSVGQGSMAGLTALRFRGSVVGSGTATVSIKGSQGGAVIMQDNPNWSVVNQAGINSVTAALAANLVVKSAAGTLYTLDISADSTLSGAAWWAMVYNATSAPTDGAVTPAKCYAVTSGTPQLSLTFGAGGVAFNTGITVGVSTTGCFTKSASTHAFIAADFQ